MSSQTRSFQDYNKQNMSGMSYNSNNNNQNYNYNQTYNPNINNNNIFHHTKNNNSYKTMPNSFQSKDKQEAYDTISEYSKESSTKDQSTCNEQFKVNEDIFGNTRGYCTICQGTCSSYTQLGQEDLRCEICGCGASAHQLFNFEDYEPKFIEIATKDILPKFNKSVSLKGINFNSFVVLYKVINQNINPKNLTWFYNFIREAGFTILKTEIKQIKKELQNSSGPTSRPSGTFTTFHKQNNNDTSYNTPKPQANDFEIKTFTKDITFKSLFKIEELIRQKTEMKVKKGKLYSGYGTQYGTNTSVPTYVDNKDENNSNNTGSLLSNKDFLDTSTDNKNMNPKEMGDKFIRKYYNEFKRPIIMMCLNLNDSDDSIKKFEELNYIMMSNFPKVSENLELIYISQHKLAALWDSQILFPELFVVNKTFQLLVSKYKKENSFNQSVSLFKDALYSNSQIILHDSYHNSLQDLLNLTKRKMEKLKEEGNQNILLKGNKNEEVEDFMNFYLNNEKFLNSPCCILEIAITGFNKELINMSSVLSFNNDFTITQYTDEEDCENFSNFYFTDTQLPTYDRIMIMLRPFVLRNNLTEVILNIFRVNNFVILGKKRKLLTKEEIKTLYNKEFPGKAKLNYKNYELMMSDGECQFVLLSRINAYDNVKTIIGLNDKEVNVNFYRILENYFNISGFELDYDNSSNNTKINDKKGQVKKLFTSKAKSNSNSFCFQDITSLVNVNVFLKEIAIDLKEKTGSSAFSQINDIKNHLVKFGTYVNLLIYCNKNRLLCEGEANEYFSKYGNIQEVFLLVKNYEMIKESLYILKYEVLDTLRIKLTDDQFSLLFDDYLERGYVTNTEYLKLKGYIRENDVYILRMIKPGGLYEMRKIIGKSNYNFIKYAPNPTENYYKNINASNTDNFLNEKQNQIFQKLKHQAFLINNSNEIESLYPLVSPHIEIIEGNYLSLNNLSDTTQLIAVLESCLKLTVGEKFGRSDKSENEQRSLIERYLNYYFLLEQSSDIEEYFIECLRSYMLPKFEGNAVNCYFEFIDYSLDREFKPFFAYFVESENLGFFEIKIPYIEYPLNENTSVNMIEYLQAKYYLYSDNDFYAEFREKERKKPNALTDFLPFDKGKLYQYLKVNVIQEIVNEFVNNEEYQQQGYNKLMKVISNLTYHNLFQGAFNGTQLEKNIINRIFYLTKYESTRLFIQRYMAEFPREFIVPQSYHYVVKPDDIFLPINRIFEVEEFGGLNFIEIALLDYFQSRAAERNERIIQGTIINYTSEFTKDINFKRQYSLPAFLWGKKLAKLCANIEDMSGSPVRDYGPVIFNPKYNDVVGLIDEDCVFDYETYLYVNIMEDLKENKDGIFDPKELQQIEKKLYKILNSEIFKKTRKKENIRLVPTRINDNNLRANKSQSTKIRDTTAFVDPKYEMKLHKTFKAGEDSTYQASQNVRTETELSDKYMKEIDEEVKTIFKDTTSINDIGKYKNILSKKVYLSDCFYQNGMKYQPYAAVEYLLKVYYRTLNRKEMLINLPLPDQEKAKEYDMFLDAMIQGFESRKKLNYKNSNDSEGNNVYHIEFFFYCLKEVKFMLNEIDFNNKQIKQIDDLNLQDDDPNYNNLQMLRQSLKDTNDLLVNTAQVVKKQIVDSKIQRTDKDLGNKETIVPKSKYYIPITFKEKYEKNIQNSKYMMTKRVKYPVLQNYNKLETPEQKKAFMKYGFEVENDYYLVHKTMLREPRPELSNTIDLNPPYKASKDKTGLTTKLFGHGMFGDNYGIVNKGPIDEDGRDVRSSMSSYQTSFNDKWSYNSQNNTYKRSNKGKEGDKKSKEKTLDEYLNLYG